MTAASANSQPTRRFVNMYVTVSVCLNNLTVQAYESLAPNDSDGVYLGQAQVNRAAYGLIEERQTALPGYWLPLEPNADHGEVGIKVPKWELCEEGMLEATNGKMCWEVSFFSEQQLSDDEAKALAACVLQAYQVAGNGMSVELVDVDARTAEQLVSHRSISIK